MKKLSLTLVTLLILGLTALTPSLSLQTKEHYIINSSVQVNVMFGAFEGKGSGVVLEKQGNSYLILTNNHVVNSAEKVFVIFMDKTYRAKVLKASQKRDLALLRITPATYAPLHPVELCTEAPRRFQIVYAVGGGLGLVPFPTKGIISNPNAIVKNDDKAIRYIQHSSPIAPGNSGGGLYKWEWDKGYCIQGINSMGYMGFPDISFAIPVETINKFLGNK